MKKKHYILLSLPILFILPSILNAHDGEKVKGFRELKTSENEIVSRLNQKVEGESTLGILRIENPFSAWADVTVEDVEVGVIGPYGIAEIEVKSPHTWYVRFKLPNGYSSTKRFDSR